MSSHSTTVYYKTTKYYLLQPQPQPGSPREKYTLRHVSDWLRPSSWHHLSLHSGMVMVHQLPSKVRVIIWWWFTSCPAKSEWLSDGGSPVAQRSQSDYLMVVHQLPSEVRVIIWSRFTSCQAKSEWLSDGGSPVAQQSQSDYLMVVHQLPSEVRMTIW